MQVNGEQVELARPMMSLGEFLCDMDCNPVRVVVERNGEIVARNTYGTTPLTDADVLEILHFVGGG